MRARNFSTALNVLRSVVGWLAHSSVPSALLSLGILLVLTGCANGSQSDAAETPRTSPVPVPTGIARATLVPTFTPAPAFVPRPTPSAGHSPAAESPDEQQATSIPFEQIIVDLTYRIPALGLERRLQGNMANRITLSDLSNGQTREYTNQGGVLLELRGALSEMELESPPAECQTCVFIEYELFLEQSTGSGWLQDAVMLASIENYLAIGLGPHFPPDTALGFRRSASPYAPAHTLALTSDGRLWTWLATDFRVPEPTFPVSDTIQLQGQLQSIPIADLNEEYVVPCEGSPVETLILAADGQSRTVSILCPEFSLPSTLLPLYLQLDALLAPTLAEASLPRPPSAFPLSAVLDYKRADGARLTLFQDGTARAMDEASAVITRTLSSSQVMSLTAELLASGELALGLSSFDIRPTATFTPGAAAETGGAPSVLVVRGPEGLYEATFDAAAGVEILTSLDALLNDLLGIEVDLPSAATPSTEETAAAKATPTPAATGTPTATPTSAP